MSEHSEADRPIRVLFVCLGNICRSPVAEAVFRDVVRRRGLGHAFEIDSSGTGSWHVGHPPDSRMRATAERHGINMDGMRARQFTAGDHSDFDHIFAMDKDNLQDILALDPGAPQRDGSRYRVRLFREADPEPEDFQVPDPYYGGDAGFERVFEMVLRTSEVLVDRFEEEFGLVRKL